MKRASIRSLRISPANGLIRVRTEIRVAIDHQREVIRLDVLCRMVPNPRLEATRQAAIKRAIELLQMALVPGA